MASQEEEERLLEDEETSNEISNAALSSVFEGCYVTGSDTSRTTTRSNSQTFVPVEVSHVEC